MMLHIWALYEVNHLGSTFLKVESICQSHDGNLMMFCVTMISANCLLNNA